MPTVQYWHFTSSEQEFRIHVNLSLWYQDEYIAGTDFLFFFSLFFKCIFKLYFKGYDNLLYHFFLNIILHPHWTKDKSLLANTIKWPRYLNIIPRQMAENLWRPLPFIRWWVSYYFGQYLKLRFLDTSCSDWSAMQRLERSQFWKFSKLHIGFFFHLFSFIRSTSFNTIKGTVYPCRM